MSDESAATSPAVPAAHQPSSTVPQVQHTRTASPALLIVLVISNVLTLLALAVCVTLLVAHGGGAMQEAQSTAGAELREEAEQLRELYLRALEQQHGQPTGQDLGNAPPEGLEAWSFLSAEVAREARHSQATFVSHDRTEVELLGIGDDLEGHTLQRIEPHRVVMLDDQGETHIMRRERLTPRSPEVPMLDLDRWQREPEGYHDSPRTRRPADQREGEGSQAQEVEGSVLEFEDGSEAALPEGVDPESFVPPEVDAEALPGMEAETAQPAGQMRQVAPPIVYEWIQDYDAQLDALMLRSEYDSDAARYTGVRINELPRRLTGYGVQPGDVLVEVNGHVIERALDLDRLPEVADFSEGVRLVIRRNGIYHEVELDYSRSQFEDYVEQVEEQEATRQQQLEELRAQLEAQGDSDASDSDANGEANDETTR